jgi:preprotein translocase subunit YajC
LEDLAHVATETIVQIVSGVLAVACVVIIIMRRKKKKKQQEDEF